MLRIGTYLAVELPRIETGVNTPAHGVEAPTSIYQLEWIIFVALAATVLLLAAIGVARLAVESSKKGGIVGVGVFVASLVVTVLGVIGTVGHAAFVSVGAKEAWAPNLDVVTIGWLAVALVGMLLPRISEVTVGGVNFRIAAEAKESESIIQSSLELAKEWLDGSNRLLAELGKSSATKALAQDLVRRFLEENLEYALDWIGDKGERRRISIWMYESEGNKLVFLASNQSADPIVEHTQIPNGRGFVGNAFERRRIFNKKDAPRQPMYLNIPGTRSIYNASMSVPIDYGSKRIGVLLADREQNEKFTDQALSVASAAAYMFGTILGNARTIDLLSRDEG